MRMEQTNYFECITKTTRHVLESTSKMKSELLNTKNIITKYWNPRISISVFLELTKL